MNYLKRFILTTLVVFSSLSCQENENTSSRNHLENISDFKGEMRSFVINLSKYAKQKAPSFYIIPQNGTQLVTIDGTPKSPIHKAYLDAIDAHGQESLFYGYYEDDGKTPDEATSYTSSFLDKSKKEGNKILVTDYCSSISNVEDSYKKNTDAGYVSFAANQRNLTNIYPPYGINNKNEWTINTLDDVKNFLFLLNTEEFETKEDLISNLSKADYDLIVIDAFFKDGTWLTKKDINRLKQKTNGEKRLVISYLSIGEAEEYRYYWKELWLKYKPDWLAEENPNWGGNYKVRYWDEEWQQIIYGSKSAYLDNIIDIGFDGAYLDIIDAFQYFEEKIRK